MPPAFEGFRGDVLDLIEVEILNWEKFNARSDRANYSWFRFQNDFFANQKLFGLSDAQVVLYLMLICEVSKKNRPTVEISLSYIATIRKTTETKIIKDIQTLVNRGVIMTAESRHSASLLPATDRQTDITDRQTDTVCTVVQSTPVPTQIRSDQDLIPLVSEKVLALYAESPEYVAREAIKAWAWAENNVRKSPKSVRGWRQFFTGWLERGWERHRKSLPSIADPTNHINWEKYGEGQDAG